MWWALIRSKTVLTLESSSTCLFVAVVEGEVEVALEAEVVADSEDEAGAVEDIIKTWDHPKL